MTAVSHVSSPALTARVRTGRRLPFRVSSGLAAVGAVAAAMALTLYADLPWNAAPTAPSPQPLPPFSADAAPAFAHPVDWSRIEPAEDPGPMAVAAYGP